MLKRKMAATMAIFFLSILLMISKPVKAADPILSIVDSVNGQSTPTFPPVLNSTFVMNITIKDVVDLFGWQINVTWNQSTIQIMNESNVFTPADHIFSYATTTYPTAKTLDQTHGWFVWAIALGPGETSFNGNGTIIQMNFTVINVTDIPRNSPIAFSIIGTLPTALSNTNGDPITFVTEPAAVTIYPEFGSSGVLVIMLAASILIIAFSRVLIRKKPCVLYL